MEFNQFPGACGFAIGVIMHQNPHDVLRTQLIFIRQSAKMARRVDEKQFVAPRCGPIFIHNQQTGRNARAVKQVERQADDGIDQIGFEQTVTNQKLVIGFAPAKFRIAFGVELAGFFVHFGLAAKQHALRTHHATTSRFAGLRVGVFGRGDDVLNKREIAIAQRWRAEAKTIIAPDF